MEFTQALDWLIVGIPCVFCVLFVVDFVTGLFKLWDEMTIKSSPVSQPINYFPEPLVLPQLRADIQSHQEVAMKVQTEQTSPQPKRRGRPKKQSTLQNTPDEVLEVITKRSPGRPRKTA
jgi:hypothetical protein